jgi:hypothetical protein
MKLCHLMLDVSSLGFKQSDIIEFLLAEDARWNTDASLQPEEKRQFVKYQDNISSCPKNLTFACPPEKRTVVITFLDAKTTNHIVLIEWKINSNRYTIILGRL